MEPRFRVIDAGVPLERVQQALAAELDRFVEETVP
jgi:hypothetical protein